MDKAGFSAGQSVLSIAVGGAVGNATIQLAKALGATLVITTAGSAEKAKVAAAAGFDKIKPTIGKIFSAAQVGEANRFLVEDRPFGKVLIKF